MIVYLNHCSCSATTSKELSPGRLVDESADVLWVAQRGPIGTLQAVLACAKAYFLPLSKTVPVRNLSFLDCQPSSFLSTCSWYWVYSSWVVGMPSQNLRLNFLRVITWSRHFPPKTRQSSSSAGWFDVNCSSWTGLCRAQHFWSLSGVNYQLWGFIVGYNPTYNL